MWKSPQGRPRKGSPREGGRGLCDFSHLHLAIVGEEGQETGGRPGACGRQSRIHLGGEGSVGEEALVRGGGF